MKFFNPKTLSVSLTGTACQLKCDHCFGHYLKAMVTPKEALQSDANSMLISGGFNQKGQIPLYENREILLELKSKNKKLNVHPGFLRDKDIDLLKELNAVISFDFTQDERVIDDIYHLSVSPKDYEKQYWQLLHNGLSVVPHVCLGLGEVDADKKTLEKIAELNPPKTVLLIFRPTRETPLYNKATIEIKTLEKLWQQFRENYFGQVILGCMRPGGSYREKVDKLALELGFDGIVKPTPTIQKKFKNMQIIDECCAFS